MTESVSHLTSIPAPKQLAETKNPFAAQTLSTLSGMVDPSKLTSISNKSSEEVTQLQQEISEIVPAGNVVGLIVNSLTQFKDRVIPSQQAGRDVEALMRALDVLQNTIYNTAVFASPAAVLSAYQKMLALTGKDVQSAFPEGLWQFYLEFSMREDTARHTNELGGFHQALEANRLQLQHFDQLSAWVMAVINIYFLYDDLLLTEWSERVYLNLLEAEAELTNRNKDAFFKNLKRKWIYQKPYRRVPGTEAQETYLQFRRQRFQQFCHPRLHSLPLSSQEAVQEKFQQRLTIDAPSYQEQLSLLATLDPVRYREIKRAFPLWQARVAIVWQGEYHLLPACAVNEQGHPLCFSQTPGVLSPVPMTISQTGQLIHPQHGPVTCRRNGALLSAKTSTLIGHLRPLPVDQVRQWVWAIVTGYYHTNANPADFYMKLLQLPRREQEKARRKLGQADALGLELLKMAPVIINWDQRDCHQPLSIARLGQRGVGDHAMTIFCTQQTMIFDLSHIFFDGVWGLSLAEILTNEAVTWAVYLAQQPPIALDGGDMAAIPQQVNHLTPEASAESNRANLPQMRALRQNLLQRSTDMSFTINDLLILYRSLFNQEYKPSSALQNALDHLSQTSPQHAQNVRLRLQKLAESNPALLIPMDAVDGSPKDRLYPISFRNPFPEFLDLFYQTYNALKVHQQNASSSDWKVFIQLRNQLFDELHFFGHLMLHHKQLAQTGESTSLATLKLLGHLPGMVQSMLDKIPQNFEALNEMLKGEEVFSNMGRVPPGASPVRFLSARDDNDAKSMVWGILTDDRDVMMITLRDFRPEVTALFEIERPDIAQMIAQDFLDDYVSRLNQFTERLNQIAAATIEGAV